MEWKKTDTLKWSMRVVLYDIAKSSYLWDILEMKGINTTIIDNIIWIYYPRKVDDKRGLKVKYRIWGLSCQNFGGVLEGVFLLATADVRLSQVGSMS